MTASARRALGLALLCFVCYNANLREIGSYDSQPAKFLPAEIVLRQTLTLDDVVARQPAYALRSAFAPSLDGHYRPAYSIASPLAAAPVAWLLAKTGAIDLEGPLSPALIAKLTASLLCSLSVALLFLAARRRCPDTMATVIALGFGLGTNVWALASQTLWTHESVMLGLALAVWALARSREEIAARHLWIASAGLGWAGFARPQVAPIILIVTQGVIWRRRQWRDLPALAPLAALTMLAIFLNVTWFGHLLGAVPRLEALHPQIHQVDSSLTASPGEEALGLLFSPSRGLLVFSPVVLVALLGVRTAWREGARGDLRWWLLAGAAQYALYSCYSVWWAGHTYGPRYMIDLLPLGVPLAAAGVAWLTTRPVRAWVGGGLLAWSVGLAATGAWCYPQDNWNTDPNEIDRNHVRLWDWRDPQFVRCWTRGLSPQNFAFIDPAAFTRPAALETSVDPR